MSEAILQSWVEQLSEEQKQKLKEYITGGKS